MKSGNRKWLAVVVALLIASLVWAVASRLNSDGDAQRRGIGGQPVPVEVSNIERGPIEMRRTFSGALESTAEFVVAPKVGGRVERLIVDLADTVKRGRVVARLDNDEYVQAVAQAEADLAVAQANRSEAQSALEIAEREYKRVQTLRERGVASDSQLDAARAQQLAARARLEVAGAQVTKAEASLETARIRLGYTTVTADWAGGDEQRLVAERFVDEGDTVSANAPLLSIIELDPITGVIFVTEKDYARLETGQPAKLFTDAFANEPFEGHVARIAPIFKEGTRQARVELTVRNANHRLKPGMFIRVTVVLDRIEDAVIVPETALTRRDDRTGVFLVSEAAETVSWREVEPGIRQGGRVQVNGLDFPGRVVTLGQQMIDDGSAITIPENRIGDAAKPGEDRG